jgi:hypothetical protein
MPRKLPIGEVEKNGKWFVRVRYSDAEGKRHAVWRLCEERSAASAAEVRAQIEYELREQKIRSEFAAFVYRLLQLA